MSDWLATENAVDGVAADGSGKLLALATSALTGDVWDGRLLIVDAATRAVRWESVADAGLACVAWLPLRTAEHGMVAAGTDDGDVLVWSVGERLQSESVLGVHEDVVSGLASLSDRARLASACFDGAVRVWDVEKASVEQTWRLGAAVDAVAALSVGGAAATRLAAAARGTHVARVLDVRASAAAAVVSSVHGGDYKSLAWMGEHELVCGGEDGSVDVWDVRNVDGGALSSSRVHTANVTSVTVSGARVATSSEDGTVHVATRGGDGGEWATLLSQTVHEGSIVQSTAVVAGEDAHATLFAATRTGLAALALE